ncbi:MAG: transposase domain-containing protein [Pseudomonas sp.]
MSLIQSARLNGHDPYVYRKDVLSRLPTQRASNINELLPHRWQPTQLRKTGCPDAYGTGRATLTESTLRTRDQNRHLGLPVSRRAVGSTLLIKGLGKV